MIKKNTFEIISGLDFQELTTNEIDTFITSLALEKERREEETFHNDWMEVVKALDNFFAKGYDFITLNLDNGREEWDIEPESDYKSYDGVITI